MAACLRRQVYRPKWLIQISLLALLTGCGGGSSVDVASLAAGRKSEVYGEKDISAKGSLADNLPSEAINFGITPWEDPEKLRRMHEPFLAYLSEKMHVRIRFMVAQEYHDLVSDLKRGIIHIAAFSSGAYSDALEEGIGKDAIYIASTQNDGNSYYRGQIITRPGIKSLNDLRGKSFAFVEKGSSSGYKFPLALLLQKGIDPYKFFSKIYYLGSHAHVVEAVVNGKADAGATHSGFSEKSSAFKEKKISVLMKTDPIPYDAIVVYRKKGTAFAEKLQKHLLAINRETTNAAGEKVLNKALGSPYSGYVVHPPKIYEVVRQTSRLVKAYKPPPEKKNEP